MNFHYTIVKLFYTTYLTNFQDIWSLSRVCRRFKRIFEKYCENYVELEIMLRNNAKRKGKPDNCLQSNILFAQKIIDSGFPDLCRQIKFNIPYCVINIDSDYMFDELVKRNISIDEIAFKYSSSKTKNAEFLLKLNIARQSRIVKEIDWKYSSIPNIDFGILHSLAKPGDILRVDSKNTADKIKNYFNDSSIMFAIEDYYYTYGHTLSTSRGNRIKQIESGICGDQSVEFVGDLFVSGSITGLRNIALHSEQNLSKKQIKINLSDEADEVFDELVKIPCNYSFNIQNISKRLFNHIWKNHKKFRNQISAAAQIYIDQYQC